MQSGVDVKWQCKGFNELELDELYEILRVRQEVFAVEQDCVYQDVDNLDQQGWHLFCLSPEASDTQGPARVLAYLRILPAGLKYTEASIGRVLTAQSGRGMGLGRELLNRGLQWLQIHCPEQSVRISAQQYLQEFYQSYGFETVSAAYLEDGIPHIEMLRSASRKFCIPQ